MRKLASGSFAVHIGKWMYRSSPSPNRWRFRKLMVSPWCSYRFMRNMITKYRDNFTWSLSPAAEIYFVGSSSTSKKGSRMGKLASPPHHRYHRGIYRQLGQDEFWRSWKSHVRHMLLIFLCKNWPPIQLFCFYPYTGKPDPDQDIQLFSPIWVLSINRPGGGMPHAVPSPKSFFQSGHPPGLWYE